MSDTDLTATIARIRRTRAWQAYTLLAWSVGSVVIGGAIWLLSRHGDAAPAFWRALGVQFVVWGAIDLVFAVLGVRQSRGVAGKPAAVDEIAGRDILIKSLVTNQWLNALWLTTGVALIAIVFWRPSLSTYGHGLGVLIQGGFLTVLDTIFLCQSRAQQRTESREAEVRTIGDEHR